MGPECTVALSSSFSEKLPPSFEGRSSYAVYRQDVELWLSLTTLEANRQGSALIGRLAGESKSSAKTFGVPAITAANGAAAIINQLDKAYANNATNQLDSDLADFLDFTWTRNMSISQFVAGFHSRMDKIASLNIDEKLKGHLVLR